MFEAESLASNYHKALFSAGLRFENTAYIKNGGMNDWHFVKMTSSDGLNFKWTNKAGVVWSMTAQGQDAAGRPT